MEYKNIMIITIDEKSVLYSDEAIELGVDVNKYFPKRNLLLKILSQIDKKLDTTFSQIGFGAWKSKLKDVELLILNSHFFSRPVIKYIKKRYPNIRIVIWYSNPVHTDTPISFFQDLDCEIWSFDSSDVDEYNLFSNIQFIDAAKLRKKSIEDKYKSDICFIGLDKGRLPYLLELKKQLIQMNIDPLIYVVDSSKNSSENFAYLPALPYQELLNYEGNSKAILDIVQGDQIGLSLRPIESLFLRVKIVTNNKNIKNYDFYNDINCFLLNERPLREIKDFIGSPYKEIPESILQQYTFKGWIDNIIYSN